MPPVVRILKLLGALVAFVVYVWAAAVRALPHVRRRKAAKQLERHGGKPVLRRDA